MIFSKKTLTFLVLLLVFASGCNHLSTPWKLGNAKKKKTPAKNPYRVSYVRDYAHPYGMHLVAIEGFGLVCGLRGNGAPEPPGVDREMILRELQKANVDRPNELLDSTDTAVVRLSAIMLPGVQQGDRFDVALDVKAGSEVKSLRGGYLFHTTLKEMGVELSTNALRQGTPLADAGGPVMLSPSIGPQSNPMELTHGKILGGGIARKDRPLYLTMKDEHISEYNTKRIADQINKRFYTKQGGKTEGVAKAKTDTIVELRVHPIYKDNIERYMQVLLSVVCYETNEQRAKRLDALKRTILDPKTAQDSALKLEALGKPGIETLLAGMKSSNPEIRFYCAESLAYLDVVQSVKPLAEIAKTEPAFRIRALGALSSMKSDLEAESVLREMLNENSAETRYGAFRALWMRNPYDLAIRGETLGSFEGASQFNYHVLNITGAPMIHVTYSKHPELVLFGSDIQLIPNFILDAGTSILVTCTNGTDEVKVTRLGSIQSRMVTTRLDEIVKAIVDLGGTYPDIVQMLLEAQAQKALPCKVEIDKLPQGGRLYTRSVEEEVVEEEKKRSFWNRLNPNTWIDDGNDPADLSSADWKD